MPSRPASALIGEVVGEGFLQSDDKSWDITLPSAWEPSSANLRSEPGSLFSLHADRRDKGGSLDVRVTQSKGKMGLSDLGKLDVVAQQYKALQPQPAELVSQAIVPGAVKGSSYYSFTYALGDGGGTSRVKLAVSQNRIYALTVRTKAGASDEVEAEAAAIVSSFKAFPVNIICLSQSNAGSVPAPGSCY